MNESPSTSVNAPSAHSPALSLRARAAVALGQLARCASRSLGRGSGGNIGGEVALRVAPRVLEELGRTVVPVVISGTNGKSTTTRMVAAALSQVGNVASNTNGDNMTPGVASALITHPHAQFAALEVDEMHVPEVAAQVRPRVFIFLNLSRDQLDRVGEIGAVEARLRQAVHDSAGAVILANCDDPLVVSAAGDSPHVQWVAAGAGWGGDEAAYPRGGRVVRDADSWHLVPRTPGEELPAIRRRPEPDWWLSDVELEGASSRALVHGPNGIEIPVVVNLPGRVNVSNAMQAIAAAYALGVPLAQAAQAVGTVREVAGRYAIHDIDGRRVRVMLAKNPAGWQEAIAMMDPHVNQVVIGVNGQVPDGQDLSWLWDVDFSQLSQDGRRIFACGERGADLAVRLEYAGIHCVCVDTPFDALTLADAGQVEMLLNYTALRDFNGALAKRGTGGAQ